ncbi:MAG TPA: response regulator [Anaerolineales bacterium]|nr:response regulator [Anaerolineales bacterium]
MIEDDATMVSLLRILLGMEGYEVVELENWKSLRDTLAELRQQKPALILLDVNLKGWSGFELLQEIRSDETLRATRVIMASGMDVRERSEHFGANGFIQKPYMPEELITQIRETLETLGAE